MSYCEQFTHSYSSSSSPRKAGWAPPSNFYLEGNMQMSQDGFFNFQGIHNAIKNSPKAPSVYYGTGSGYPSAQSSYRASPGSSSIGSFHPLNSSTPFQLSPASSIHSASALSGGPFGVYPQFASSPSQHSSRSAGPFGVYPQFPSSPSQHSRTGPFNTPPRPSAVLQNNSPFHVKIEPVSPAQSRGSGPFSPQSASHYPNIKKESPQSPFSTPRASIASSHGSSHHSHHSLGSSGSMTSVNSSYVFPPAIKQEVLVHSTHSSGSSASLQTVNSSYVFPPAIKQEVLVEDIETMDVDEEEEKEEESQKNIWAGRLRPRPTQPTALNPFFNFSEYASRPSAPPPVPYNFSSWNVVDPKHPRF